VLGHERSTSLYRIGHVIGFAGPLQADRLPSDRSATLQVKPWRRLGLARYVVKAFAGASIDHFAVTDRIERPITITGAVPQCQIQNALWRE